MGLYRYQTVMVAGLTPEERTEVLTRLGQLGYRLVQVDQGIAYLESPDD